MATREQLAIFSRRLQENRERFLRITPLEWVSMLAPPLAIAALLLFGIVHFLKPLPPTTLRIATGGPRGTYTQYAEHYRATFAHAGIKLEIRNTSGVNENLALLRDPHHPVDAAMMQDGFADPDTPGILSAGAIGYEPIWIFYRGTGVWTRLSDLAGKTINVGYWGGGAQTFAIELLREAGLTYNSESFSPPGHNVHLTTLTGPDALEALRSGRIDAVITLGEPGSSNIQALFHTPGIHVMDIEQAAAISRHRPFLHRLVIPRGGIDLNGDLPAHDVQTIATTSVVYVREDLHPALVTLLSQAMAQTHQNATVLNAKHEFPADLDESVAPHPGAIRFMKNGAPLLMRYLPFWLATLLDRTFVVVVPLLALLIPLSRLLPQIYNWRIRRKLDRWYAELKFLEAELDRDDASTDRNILLDRTAWIEQQLAQLRIPLAFSNQLYILREHLELVRRRVLRVTRDAKPPAGPAAEAGAAAI